MRDISKSGYYRSWYELAKRLPAEKRDIFNMMILDYQFEGIEPPETHEFFYYFILIKANIDKDIQRRMAGTNGGKASKTPKHKENDESEPVDNSVDKSVDNSVDKSVDNSVDYFFNPPVSLASNVDVNEDEDVDENVNEKENDDDDDDGKTSSSPSFSKNLQKKLKNGENIDLELSQQQTRYAQIVFELFKKADLPCQNDDFTQFMQKDFENAKLLLKQLHSSEVLQAVKNYVYELNAKDSYTLKKLPFDSFLKSKTFQNCLPQNYKHENFVSYEKQKDKSKEEPTSSPKQNLWKNKLSQCPICGKETSENSDGTGRLWYCRNCHEDFEYKNGEWQKTA